MLSRFGRKGLRANFFGFLGGQEKRAGSIGTSLGSLGSSMKFGKTIRLEQNLSWNTKWVDFYLEYKELKQMLRTHLDPKTGEFLREAEFFERFLPRWKREVLKIDGMLKRQCSSLIAKLEGETSLDSEKTLRYQLNLKRLSQFSDINHEGLMKFLKKLEKNLDDDLQGARITTVEKLREKIITQRSKHDEALESINAKIDGKSMPQSKQEFDRSEAQERLNEVEIEEPVPILSDLVLDSLKPGKITRLKLALIPNELGDFTIVHVIVAKGKYGGPVLGVTSALHGNELNGIPLIFRLFREIDVDTMKGTLVAVPVLNPPGYQRRQRAFHDGQDLNRLFPGKADGNCGQVYAYNVLEKIVKNFDYHIDMHTASFGRKNSLYVRADMRHPIAHQMAALQHPQIIVHNTAPDGSLRCAAMANNIPSITVEIGDPLVFHNKYISTALYGVENVMRWLDMQAFDDDDENDASDIGSPVGDSAIEKQVARAKSPKPKSPKKPREQMPRRNSLNPFSIKTTLCARSKWIYSPHGGILRVKPDVNTWVEEGQTIAIVQNLFGDVIFTLKSPVDAIVVGKSTNPICAAGDRIVHLGFVEDELPEGKVDDGHT